MKTFAKEQRWLHEHGKEYEGQWVAVAGDKLISHGDKAKEVLAKARALGVRRPLLVRPSSEN